MIKNYNMVKKALHILAILLIFVSCNPQNMINKEINNIIEQLKNGDISEKEIIENHFVAKTDNEGEVMELEVLKQLKTTVTKSNYEVIPYVKVKNRDTRLLELINEDQKQNVVVVHFVDEEEIPNMYILFENNKIKSIIPIIKSDKIIGWM